MKSQSKWTAAGIVLVAAIVGIVAVIVSQGALSLGQPAPVQAQGPAGSIPPAAPPQPAPAPSTNLKPVLSPTAPAGAGAAPQDVEKPACLDLSAFVGMKAADFDKVKGNPWPAVPRGSQTLVGVPVDIRGALLLWGQGNADKGAKYPESISGIPCRQKFAALYILHGSFYEGAADEPVFEVVLKYEGGEQQTDAILSGADGHDWYVKPTGPLGPTSKRSTLAWVGAGKAGERDQTIRFCMTAIENKHPDRVVETIDLVSSKKKAAGCILAITVGQAGLVKPMPDKPAAPRQKTAN